MSKNSGYKPYQNRLEEHFFEFLVEGITSEIFVSDAKGNIIYMNPYSEHIMNKDRADLIGTNINEILDSKVISCSVTNEVLETKKVSRAIQEIGDGKELLAVGTPFFDDNNNLQYILTTTYDVGEICSINNKLEAENRKLLLKMKTMSFYKDQFFEDSDHIFAGEAMEAVVNTVVRIAPLATPVLIFGETGVGKESVAKMIHRLSKEKDGAFVKVNCSQLGEDDIETELFGRDTANEKKLGKIEIAQEGTLFLDEVDALPMAIQNALADFMKEKAIVPGGRTGKIPIKTRVIATSHVNLKDKTEAGQFSEALFYCLNILPVEIPPLRQRKNEIIHLAQYFLHKCNGKYYREKSFDKDIVSVLANYEWPGNVRELEHVIERLYLTSADNVITGEELIYILDDTNIRKEQIICTNIMPLKEAKHEIEIQLVKRACREGGSTYQAAKLLGVDQSTVVKLLKRHNISIHQ